MAGSLNSHTIVGNVGKDPTIKTVGDSKVANFSVATSESWTKNGEKQERVQWHNCVVWGKLAEIVEKYVSKGSKILLTGQVETRKYEKDGREIYTTETVLRGFDSKLLLLSSKGERSDADDSSSGYAAASGGGTASKPNYDEMGEIPF